MLQGQRCLVVGNPGLTTATQALAADEVAAIALAELEGCLPLPDPVDLVVVPLFCADFDALDMIDRLGAQGYRRTLQVVTKKLANRQMVLRELRSHASRQGITIHLTETA